MKHPATRLKGTPAPSWDEISTTLTGLLNRRRRLVPFPLPIQDVYWSLFPPMFRSVLAPSMEKNDYIRTRNANRVANWSSVVSVEFTTRPAQVRAFYMRFDKALPSASASDGLVMPLDCEYRGRVDEWLSAAENTDARHAELVTQTTQFLRAAGDLSTIQHAWPAIMDILKLKPEYRPVSPTTVAHLDRLLTRNQRQYIVEQLASAMMLDPYEPVAWCGYGPMGGE